MVGVIVFVFLKSEHTCIIHRYQSLAILSVLISVKKNGDSDPFALTQCFTGSIVMACSKSAAVFFSFSNKANTACFLSSTCSASVFLGGAAVTVAFSGAVLLTGATEVCFNA